MPTQTILCAYCNRSAIIHTPRHNVTFTDIAIPAYEMGWKMARGGWFCSVDCLCFDREAKEG